MSKNVIFCYSGSGNCLDIAKNIAKRLGDTDIVMMRAEPEVKDVRGAKRVGFVFPCYAGGLPGDVEKFVSELRVDPESYTFGVDRTAELIALAGGDPQRLTCARADVGAVASAARRAVIACGNDLVIAHDYRAVFAAQAGGALKHRVGNVEVIVLLACPVVHGVSSGRMYIRSIRGAILNIQYPACRVK